METKQATYVTLAATDNVSIFSWRGKSTINLKESQLTSVEVSEIDTTELLRAVSLFVRNRCTDTDKNETDTRILRELLKSMEASLKDIEVAA